MKKTPEDRVCAECKGILKWYVCSDGEAFWFHHSLRKGWVIKDHAPNPLPIYVYREDRS